MDHNYYKFFSRSQSGAIKPNKANYGKEKELIYIRNKSNQKQIKWPDFKISLH